MILFIYRNTVVFDTTAKVVNIKMVSLTGEDCLGHEGTLNLLESWREILRERQLKDDDEIRNNTITVSVGPQFEADMSRICISI